MTIRRFVVSLLVLLVALASIVGLNVSAAAAAGPETRDRAIPTVTAINVGSESGESPASVGHLRPPQPQMAVGSGVATNTVGLLEFDVTANRGPVSADEALGVAHHWRLLGDRLPPAGD